MRNHVLMWPRNTVHCSVSIQLVVSCLVYEIYFATSISGSLRLSRCSLAFFNKTRWSSNFWSNDRALSMFEERISSFSFLKQMSILALSSLHHPINFENGNSAWHATKALTISSHLGWGLYRGGCISICYSWFVVATEICSLRISRFLADHRKVQELQVLFTS